MKSVFRKIILTVLLLWVPFTASFSAEEGFRVKDIMKEPPKEIAPPIVEAIERPRVEYNASKLRDPFQGEVMKSGPEGTVAQSAFKPPELKIEGVIWGGKVNQAIINGKVLTIGDTIENARIVDIKKEGVKIFYGNREFDLPSPGMPKVITKDNPEGGNNE